MEDPKAGGAAGGGGGSSARVHSAAEAEAEAASSGLLNQRQRFSIELRTGETTIVSWKRLVKESNKPNPTPPSLEPPLTNDRPALESRDATGQPAENEAKDAPPSSRFSAVIEKIERLYMGKSSDEEELDGVPDDDQYDTEDSFIDDAELDEYFQVDKSKTKHSGFFVNRGKLEQINEPTLSPNHKPKKRRKEITKALGEKDGDHVPTKHAKVGVGHMRMKAVARTAPVVGKSSSHSQSLAAISEHYHDGKSQYPLKAPVGSSTKKPADPSYSKTSNRDASGFPVEAKDTEKQKIGITQSRDSGNKVKVASEFSDGTDQKNRDKNASTQLEPQYRRLMSDTNELELSTKVRHRDKNGSNELPDLNFPGSKYPVQPVKTASMPVKDASSVRPKGTMLERAIRELEKMVAESRPPNIEVQDADTSSIAIKRRLPREVKQKLAKVARLAQSSQGKISEELINRLMSILGHLVQLRTLKRNLREMVILGLSAKQEKADRFQQIKKDVIELIKLHVPSLKAMASGQRDGATDDFQEVLGSEEKGVHKGIYSMDNAMEDKICDLYDLYVQGMDEDKGPQTRKLYVELAELWPNRAMDNHGIKNAICRAKERRRALYIREKAQEKVRRKKFFTPRTEEIVRGEASSIAQPRAMQERLIPDSSGHILASPNRMTSSTATVEHHLAAPVRMSTPSLKDSNLDLPKQEKLERLATLPASKEHMKQQQRELESKAKKLSLKLEKETHKSHKQAAGHPHKSSHQSAAPPSSCERPS